MKTDLLLDTFAATWQQVRSGALAAEAAGFDGLWVYDHLSGAVHGAPHVLECWTVLGGLAAVTQRVSLGPLVLNMANRDPGVLAQMAATLQHVTEGRLLLGLGAGSGPSSAYALEDRALGRVPRSDPARRRALRRYVADLRNFWSRGDGFLRPGPPPPIVVAALGPKTARLAGEVGDGVNLFASRTDLEALIVAARQAARQRDVPDSDFLVTVLAPVSSQWLDPDGAHRHRLAGLGVDRLILAVKPPYDVVRDRVLGKMSDY